MRESKQITCFPGWSSGIVRGRSACSEGSVALVDSEMVESAVEFVERGVEEGVEEV